MKNRRVWSLMLAAVVFAIGNISITRANELAIESFDGTGRLTFNETEGAESYRVEWAPTPGGPWTNFTGAAGAALDEIVAQGSGSVTCSVPMCYRVVALMAPPSGMVLIPGGTNAGTDPDYGAYSLTMSSFYMDKYEVTKAQWDEVYTWAITNGYSFDHAGSGKAANHPVQSVSWYDVVKWCNARSQREGRPVAYTVGGAVYKTGQTNDVVQTSAVGYRLPTDVEWEYAARGGVKNRRFSWGDTITHSQANYYSDSKYSYDTSSTRGYHSTYATGEAPYTSPAGSFAPNGYGLYDMAGNVWEWCFDWHPAHEGSFRVLRGGSWYGNADYCLVGYRDGGGPSGSNLNIGFRAVLPPDQ